jgi:multidrug efflux pump subunit AcrB
MSHDGDNAEKILATRNTARFFTENTHIAWVLLAATIAWGIYGYFAMPKRKDPEIPIRVAVAVCPWPGMNAERIEQFVTRKIEEKIAENSRVERIDSVTRSSVSIVYVYLREGTKDVGVQFDDVKLKLDAITDLPQGAGPIRFMKDFGDTAALTLTVASPRADAVDIALRAKAVQRAVEQARSRHGGSPGRGSVIVCLPRSVNPQVLERHLSLFANIAREQKLAREIEMLVGPGFAGMDAEYALDDAALVTSFHEIVRERLHASELHPDTWRPVVIRDPRDTEARLTEEAGDKYSYADLDQFTDLIGRTLQTVPLVSKVERSGLLKERIYLEYSQERLASYGVQPAALRNILGARNIDLPGGVLEADGKNLIADPSGQFANEGEIGDVLVTATASGTPVYLRDLVDITRGYENPARFLNFYNWRDAAGRWQRTRCVTLAVQMRSGEQIGAFGKAVDTTLAALEKRLPDDLIVARVSDQPLQVEESIGLFMRSLYEAIVLVVLVALIGFWEWRSALLIAFSIPVTLAMTFGMMYMLGIDLQQVSIASLIIALGLLVDDPVVAGDAIQRDLDAGYKPGTAAWLGPTRLAQAILFATITNIVAYLPFLMVRGDIGNFIYSLPVVLACSLVASRIVSMTFIPLLSVYLLRPKSKGKAQPSIEERRRRGFGGIYYRIAGGALEHRWVVLACSFLFLAAGGYLVSRLVTEFFPKDLSYLSYVDVWLPEDAPLSATNDVAGRVEAVIKRVTEQYGREHPDANGHPQVVLDSLTTFAGGGGPRFWFSVFPEQQQLNYAQVLIKVNDKHMTQELVEPLQHALAAEIVGARVDVRQLETGKSIGTPVSVRISGQDIEPLRRMAEQVKQIFRRIPTADRIRDDWGAETFVVKLKVDPDRANLAGISNLDVAASSAAGLSGYPVSYLRQGSETIPVVARLRMEERAQVSDLQDLYVYSLQGTQKVPLRQVSTLGYSMENEKIRRRNQFRTLTVSCFPVPGMLPSQVFGAAAGGLAEFAAALPPGYVMEVGGEREEQLKGFEQLGVVMAISVVCIFLALVIQFRNAVKPLIVFAAIPYGVVGAFAALLMMGTPFGFMAFLGIASLIGVIVSHVIVLFDFIEERHRHGDPLREALLDAGIMRLRPVMITVGATVFGLIPLALHGGPLWEPLCYAQIGGLTIATFVTLLLVPVLYSIFVLDLKLVKWEAKQIRAETQKAMTASHPGN